MINFAKIIGQIAAKLFKKKAMFIIDVSHHNGVIDWKKVTTNNPKVDGAILKATEGATGQDKKFLTNVAGCKANNLPWGAYHFATWNMKDVVADATQEANSFLARISAAVRLHGNPSLPIVLDTETNEATLPITAKQLELYMETFMGVIEKSGHDTAIYMSPGFSWFLPKNHKLGRYKLWVADYNLPINKINGWDKVWLHQYTQTGKCAGVVTNCDLNKSVS